MAKVILHPLGTTTVNTRILSEKAFRAGEYDTLWLERLLDGGEG